MNAIVVDASVTLSWCFPDEQTPMALKVLDRLNAGETVGEISDRLRAVIGEYRER